MKDFSDAYREELRKVQPSREFLENMKRAIPAAAEARQEYAPSAQQAAAPQSAVRASAASGASAQRKPRIRVLRTKVIAAAACLALLAGLGFLAFAPFRSGTPFDAAYANASELWPDSPSLRIGIGPGQEAPASDNLAGTGRSLICFAIDFTCYGPPGEMVAYRIEGEGVCLQEQWSKQWARGFTANAGENVRGAIGVEALIGHDYERPLTGSSDAAAAKAYYEAIQKLGGCSLIITYFQGGKPVNETSYKFVSCVDSWEDVRLKLDHYGQLVKLVKES